MTNCRVKHWYGHDTQFLYFTQNSERGILGRRKFISGHLQNKLHWEDTVAVVN